MGRKKQDETISDKRWYWILRGMLSRCENPKSASYKNYGGKGISVCEEWHDPKVFYKWAIENGYTDELTIDRIDNNGNYCPENCRWATYKEQANNTNRNITIEIGGVTKTAGQWEAEGVEIATLHLNLKDGLKDKLERLAEKENRSLNNLINTLLKEATDLAFGIKKER